jgi:sulfide:quinone oxidoreductase
MKPRQLSSLFSVSEQIFPSDLQDLAAMGFKSVICNRPDGEASDQPAFQLIEAAAKAAGLAAAYLPVTPGSITAIDVEQFDALLKELPTPILAYCRSGSRSTSLYNLAQQLP